MVAGMAVGARLRRAPPGAAALGEEAKGEGEGEGRGLVRKMHSLGNDFVVVDMRPGGKGGAGLVLGDRAVRGLCARRKGLGADCVISLHRCSLTQEAQAEAAAEAIPQALRQGGCSGEKEEGWVRQVPRCVMRIWNADGSEVGACGNATR